MLTTTGLIHSAQNWCRFSRFLRQSKLFTIQASPDVAMTNNPKEKSSGAPGGDKKPGKKEEKFILKTAKGTRDQNPTQMALREHVFGIVRSTMAKYGAEQVDTPVFELKETLTGKYGDDAKLIYDLADQGGEILSLRYDLTVPFARYLAMNKIANMKRFSMGKVYRRDNPAMTRGRYREFYQCDFDIAGQYDKMLPEVECINLMMELLNALELGKPLIKLNHRLILEGVLDFCGVPSEKFREICSSIDKLDKQPWDEVKVEMCEIKGLPEDVADRVYEYVKKSGDETFLDDLMASDLGQNAKAKAGFEDVKLFYQYINNYGIANQLRLDLSLARGLEYYTGLIYEAVVQNECTDGEDVGSVAAGGRYDNLVGIFDPKGRSTPCVGVSLGVERILTLLERKQNVDSAIRSNQTEVFVCSAQKNLVHQRMLICSELRKAGFKVEHSLKLNPKILVQLQYCEDKKIPLAVVIGESEIERGVVKLRKVDTREETEIQRTELCEALRKAMINN